MPALSIDSQRLGDVQDDLVRVVKEATRAVQHDEIARVRALRNDLARRADKATGVELALVELALAFLDRLTPSAISKEASLIHELLGRENADAARSILGRLASGETVAREAWDRVDAYSAELLALLAGTGVFQVGRKRVLVAPTWRSRLEELVEPAPFRTWRTVEWARKLAAFKRELQEQAMIVAGVTGVSVAQARIFIEENGFQKKPTVEPVMKPRYRRNPQVGPKGLNPPSNDSDAIPALATLDPPTRNEAPEAPAIAAQNVSLAEAAE